MSSWIDISVPLRHGMPHWPDDQPFELHRDHDMAQGAENNLSSLKTSAHVGTHMDAPLHFINGGSSIDQVPLDVVIGPARVIEIEDAREIPIAELEKHAIQPGERLLFRTANSHRAWKADEFQKDFVAIGEAAAKWLAERRPALVGVDYLSVAPFADGGPTHRALLGAGVWVIEGLNLEGVEPGRYELVCLPLKIAGAEGAPARAVIRRAPLTEPRA